LRTTRVSSVSLPSTVGQSCGSVATTETPADAAATASAATASEQTSPSASRVVRSCIAPDLARDSSKRSSTMVVIRTASRRIRPR
jgi:hypothetical protein